MTEVRSAIAALLHELYDTDIPVVLTRPDAAFGDFATNVALQLAGKLGRNPRDIAEELATRLISLDSVGAAEVAGPGFINIRLNDTALTELARSTPRAKDDSSSVVIETNNPNPFKAMHIGHALNSITADAIANLLDERYGHVFRVSYHGDVGLHVGKSMWALLRFVDGDAARLTSVPQDERNTFMSRMYAEGSRAYKEDDIAKSEIAELARKSFTRDDPLYAAVYDTIFAWSFTEIDSVMQRLGCKPVERRFLESDADLRGVKIVREHVPDIFQESDGALIFKGSDHGTFDNAFVSSNGQGLYAARDLGLMQLKSEQYHPNKSYIITAEEQRDYFKGVLAAAALCFPEQKDVTVNISTGTLKLTTGKMSSRDGDVVTIEWLFDQINEAIHARGGKATPDIAAGALRYAFLRVRVGSDIIFDINEAVSIQGNSGPYLQYAHARACSILGKATNDRGGQESTTATLEDGERKLLLKISEYSEILERATSELMPHHICTYLYELAQEFNRFYEHSRIIGDEREAIRVGLVRQYQETLAGGLRVLGIVALETM